MWKSSWNFSGPSLRYCKQWNKPVFTITQSSPSPLTTHYSHQERDMHAVHYNQSIVKYIMHNIHISYTSSLFTWRHVLYSSYLHGVQEEHGGLDRKGRRKLAKTPSFIAGGSAKEAGGGGAARWWDRPRRLCCSRHHHHYHPWLDPRACWLQWKYTLDEKRWLKMERHCWGKIGGKKKLFVDKVE